MKAAIYHFTGSSEQRPKIYMDQLNTLEAFARSKGFSDTETFCDMSLNRYEQTEFNRFLSCCKQFDALITKDFYHISKNTMKCMSIMKELRSKGIHIHTLDNGYFLLNEASFEKPLNIATYCCRFGTKSELREIIPVQNDILKLYTKKKTNWSIVDQYFDESLDQRNGEQIQLMDLIQNREKYDLLLVHNLNDVHWRTSSFCRIREQLQLDIYSLQDGFLKYGKEECY